MGKWNQNVFGKKLVMTELKCLISTIYRKYDIELTTPLKIKSDFHKSCEELLVKVSFKVY